MIDFFIIGSWIMAHVFILPAVILRSQSQKNILSIFGLLFICLALTLKPNTYDLIAYIEYFKDPFPTDIGFYLLTIALAYIGLTPTEILFFNKILISFIVYLIVCIVSPKSNFYPSLLLVFGSIFFMLASQNILRQGLSVSILIFAYVDLIKNRRNIYATLLLLVISLSVHVWSIIIMMLMAFEYVTNMLSSDRQKFYYYIFFGLIFGLLSLLIINKFDVSEVYLDTGFHWEGNRSSIFIKIIIYLLAFALVHILIGGVIGRDIFFRRIYYLRILVFSFSLPLAFYGEVFSRIQVFYYSLEALFLIWLYCSNMRKANYALIFLSVSYAIAPNVLNILTLTEM